MKERGIVILMLVTLPFYSIAYAIAHILRLKDREDMPTIKEYLLMAYEESVEDC